MYNNYIMAIFFINKINIMQSLDNILKSIPWVDISKLYEKFGDNTAKDTIYALDGVNVNVGDAYSAIAGNICRATYNNSSFVKVQDLTNWNFRGPRAMSLEWLPEWYTLTTVNDWIWTKVWLTASAKTFELSAYDVIAMLSSDITRYGWMPLVFTNVLDVQSLWSDIYSDTFKSAVLLQKWLYKVAKLLWLVVFNGETAELSNFVWSENDNAILKYNWSGTMQWVYHPEKMILWDKIQDWDIVISLKENGFRSNWISSVRKALKQRFGEQWFDKPEAQRYIRLAAEPSVLYDKFLNYLNGWTTQDFEKIVDVHGIVHLSGWAFKWKFFDDLLSSRNLSADLTNLCELPEIMRLCAEWRGMNDEDIYETWNGWQGMIIIVSPNEVEKTLEFSKAYWIDAQVSWTIFSSNNPSISIKSAYSWKKIIYS